MCIYIYIHIQIHLYTIYIDIFVYVYQFVLQAVIRSAEISMCAVHRRLFGGSIVLACGYIWGGYD